MIQAHGKTGDGRPLMFIGLSEESVARLMADQPLQVDLERLGLGHGVIVIVGGITENAILEQFRSSGVMPAGA